MQGGSRALLALRCALGKGAGSCCQQRLRGRLKSRSLSGSCRQRISGAGTAGVPAGGPRGSWQHSKGLRGCQLQTRQLLSLLAKLLFLAQSSSLLGARKAPQEGERSHGHSLSVHLLPVVLGRLAAGSIRRLEGGLQPTHPTLKRLPGLWGKAHSVPTAAAENPSPEGTCFWSSRQPSSQQSEREAVQANCHRRRGGLVPCPSTRAGRCPAHPGSTRASYLPGGSADAQPGNGRPGEMLYRPVPSPRAGTSGATGLPGKGSNHQTATRASA